MIEDHTSLARSANITPQAHHAPAGRVSLFIADCGIEDLFVGTSIARPIIIGSDGQCPSLPGMTPYGASSRSPCTAIWNKRIVGDEKKRHSNECLMDPGSCLSSRAVSSQVLSVYVRLTSVFGMGTGGTAQLNHRKGVLPSNLKTAYL